MPSAGHGWESIHRLCPRVPLSKGHFCLLSSVWVTEHTPSLEDTLLGAFGPHEAAESTSFFPSQAGSGCGFGQVTPENRLIRGERVQVQGSCITDLCLTGHLASRHIPVLFITNSPSLEPSFPGLLGLRRDVHGEESERPKPLTRLPCPG